MRRLLPLALVLACAHEPPPPVHLDAPNWLLWGRKPAGAVVTYPPAAWDAGIEGAVVTEVCIDAAGHIKSLRRMEGPELLYDAVKAALQTWAFEPVPQGAACFQRRFSFEREPQPDAFFRTEGELIVTRAYHPPRPEFVPPLPPAEVDGTVYVRVCPDEHGQPRDVTVLQGVGGEVDDKIARGVMGWRYRPARLRGKAVPACKIERFMLHKGQPPQPAIPNQG